MQVSDESTKVKIVGAGAVTKKSEIPRSMGDEAGTLGGVISGVNMNKVQFARGSTVVSIEGQPAQYLTSPTRHNGANANVPAGVVVSPSQAKVFIAMGPPPGSGGRGAHLPGVTQLELDLAASADDTPEARRARRKVIRKFLEKNGREWDAKQKRFRPPTRKQIKAQMKGHDLTKPVKVGPPPPCPSPQVQWQRPGGFQGSYYTNAGTRPAQVGISSYARDGAGRFVSKVAKPYNVKPDASYLESAAARVRDTWSVKGMSVPTQGGAIQRVIGDRAAAMALLP